MIRCEVFEQREGKRARHSACEAHYGGHSSSSLVYTSPGSSSKPVGRGGNFGHLDSSHQPTSRRGCFECGDMGHFVRDYPRTRRGGLHQGSQTSTFRVAQPPTRGAVQSGRGGSYSGRGDFHSGRDGVRGGS
ncbi:hypothetical protein KY284_026705 [Solanum tuberosum]|nr:hypothetical protein KY284_026705 [Solanum tuberosum]